MDDSSFDIDRQGLLDAVNLLANTHEKSIKWEFGKLLPEFGVGETQALNTLAPVVIGGAQNLGLDTSFAHMDPPTPWVSWATTMWNASLNQNLLHPDVAPVAIEIEQLVMRWLAPYFGMSGGHMTPGSTVGNLTALWAAREIKGVKRVVASKGAHLSVAKSAHILGLDYLGVEIDEFGGIDTNGLPDDLSTSALVLTAGTTSAGAIDDLKLGENAAWLHVDAAWAGPLRFSNIHSNKLNGIERADSVAISAHKWLFQPKESGLILFKDVDVAHKSVSFGGAYLAVPNVGVLGSRGANAIPLLATLLAWGREGLADRIDRAMTSAQKLHDYLATREDVSLFSSNASGVVLWRPTGKADVKSIINELPVGAASFTSVNEVDWIRHVAANPNANIEQLIEEISTVLNDRTRG